jgi:Fic family protein
VLFQTPELNDIELSVIEEIDGLRRSTEHLLTPTHRWVRPLRRTTFARNIQASNSIEGHNVSLEDALTAAADGIPEDAADEDFASVRNYGDAMTYIVTLADDPDFSHSTDVIRSLHYMMMKHDLGARPGRWRSGPVYVWSTQSEQTVYDGPPSSEVVELTAELVHWLNGPGSDMPALIRGAMAHLNLVMIHPFKDGNGRMSRALQSLVLARDSITAPEFSSIEEYLGRNTPAYYDTLATVGQGSWTPAGDARPWLRFVLTAHHQQATTVQRRMTEARQTWEVVSEAVESSGLDERMVYSVYLAAVGRRVKRSDHIEFSEVSEGVASSDLKRLVDAGLLDAVGEKRGRHYVASTRVKNLRDAVRVDRRRPTDPFLR